jgi:hypothetical protein
MNAHEYSSHHGRDVEVASLAASASEAIPSALNAEQMLRELNDVRSEKKVGAVND